MAIFNCCAGCSPSLSASADNYLVFFIAGLVAYHGALYFLEDARVLCFLKRISKTGLYEKTAFAAICLLQAVAWLAALEYVIQLAVPHFRVSNLAGIPVALLMSAGSGLLSMFVQDTEIAWRLAAATLMPMSQVAALHYYTISNFKPCLPLPTLYVILPLVIGYFVSDRLCLFRTEATEKSPPSIVEFRSPSLATGSLAVCGKQPAACSREKQEEIDDFELKDFNWSLDKLPIFDVGADGDRYR